MKRVLKVHIGLALREKAASETPATWEPYLETFARAPLHWVLVPGRVLEKRGAAGDRLVREIRERLTRTGDMIVPAGYADAPHPLLGMKELSSELEWSRSNPWGSGLTDVFRTNPGVLIPGASDFDRPAAAELYARQGFRLIGAPLPPGAGEYRFRGTAPAGGLDLFHFYDLTGFDETGAARLAASFFPRDLERVFLLVTPDGPASHAKLAALLDALGGKAGLVIEPLAVPAEERRGATLPRMDAAALPDTPLRRGMLDKAARLRARGGLKDNELRELLVLTAGDPSEAEKIRSALAAKPVAREGTAYNANMPGDVVLPGNGFDAFFSGGRLSGLKAGREQLLPSPAPDSRVTIAGREHPLPFDRVFSFEKNDLRGLEAFVLFPGPGREHVFTLRYAFSGEVPWLFIACERLRRPSSLSDSLSSVAPIEIPIGECSPERPLEIARLYADGSSSRTAFTGAESDCALAGTVFSVPCPGGRRLVFGYLPHKSAPVSLLEVRITREKKRAAVCINPFGAYRRESIPALFETGETRSFYIGPRNEEPDKPPFFPAAALKSIPAHALYRLP